MCRTHTGDLLQPLQGPSGRRDERLVAAAQANLQGAGEFTARPCEFAHLDEAFANVLMSEALHRLQLASGGQFSGLLEDGDSSRVVASVLERGGNCSSFVDARARRVRSSAMWSSHRESPAA
jgi:hypothetical protein